jgi:hypothetical protein
MVAKAQSLASLLIFGMGQPGSSVHVRPSLLWKLENIVVFEMDHRNTHSPNFVGLVASLRIPGLNMGEMLDVLVHNYHFGYCRYQCGLDTMPLVARYLKIDAQGYSKCRQCTKMRIYWGEEVRI